MLGFKIAATTFILLAVFTGSLKLWADSDNDSHMMCVGAVWIASILTIAGGLIGGLWT
jgi:hypothetical protein